MVTTDSSEFPNPCANRLGFAIELTYCGSLRRTVHKKVTHSGRFVRYRKVGALNRSEMVVVYQSSKFYFEK